MRLALAVAVLAVAALLFWMLSEEDPGAAHDRTRKPGSGEAVEVAPDPGRVPDGPRGDGKLPDLRAAAQAADDDASRAAAIERFLADCRRLGPAAVPELLRLLREGRDIEFERRWIIRDRGVEGHPTLRSVYLSALASIPGEEATDALQEFFSGATAPGESLQAAWALAERGVSGFEGELLRRADAAIGIADLPAQRAMVELAARRAPGVTAAHVEANTPRGDEPGDPRALAFALSVLPADTACTTARGLLAEPRVTQIARSRYVRALANRPELDGLRMMRDAVLVDDWNEATRIDAAHAFVQSTAFLEDLQRIQVAQAEGDPRTVEELRARTEQRLALTREWIEVALGVDLETTDDARAANLRARLEQLEQELQRTR